MRERLPCSWWRSASTRLFGSQDRCRRGGVTQSYGNAAIRCGVVLMLQGALAYGQQKAAVTQADALHWPMVLTDKAYKQHRGTIQSAFAKLAANNGDLAYEERNAALESFDELAAELKGNIDKYEAADYGEARSYVEKLKRRFEDQSRGPNWRKPRPKQPEVPLAQQVPGGRPVDRAKPADPVNPNKPALAPRPAQGDATAAPPSKDIPTKHQWAMRDGSTIDGKAFEYAIRNCRVVCTVTRGARRGKVFVDGKRINSPQGSALFARLAQMQNHEAADLTGFDNFFSQDRDFSLSYWVLRCDSGGREVEIPIPLLADDEAELLRPSFQHWRDVQEKLAADNELRESIKRAAWAEANAQERKVGAMEELSRALDRNSNELQRSRGN
jgi:hypothetical protein